MTFVTHCTKPRPHQGAHTQHHMGQQQSSVNSSAPLHLAGFGLGWENQCDQISQILIANIFVFTPTMGWYNPPNRGVGCLCTTTCLRQSDGTPNQRQAPQKLRLTAQNLCESRSTHTFGSEVRTFVNRSSGWVQQLHPLPCAAKPLKVRANLLLLSFRLVSIGQNIKQMERGQGLMWASIPA